MLGRQLSLLRCLIFVHACRMSSYQVSLYDTCIGIGFPNNGAVWWMRTQGVCKVCINLTAAILTLCSIIQMLVVGFAPVNRSSIFLIPALLVKCQVCVDHEHELLNSWATIHTVISPIFNAGNCVYVLFYLGGSFSISSSSLADQVSDSAYLCKLSSSHR